MRLVAVLGYSPRRADGLHEVCAARVRHAQALARAGDAVLLTGEADLMGGAWAGEAVTLDPHARNTRENAAAVAATAREFGATEVVVVTSAWHAFRARVLVRAALGRSAATVTSSSPPGWRPLRLVAREAACLAILPLQVVAVLAARARVAATGLRKEPIAHDDNDGVPSAEGEHPVFRVGGISYLRVPATDPQASAAFYEAVFGWTVRGDRPDPAFEDGSGHVIGHFRADHPVVGEGGVRPYIFVENLDEALAKATAHGAQVVEEPYAEGDLWVALIRDPAGNVVGVWQHGERNAAAGPAQGSTA